MKIIETHIVPAIDEKIRLQEYAFSIFQTITTRSALKKAVKKGLILLDGQPASTSSWIKTGHRIDLLEEEKTSKKIFKFDLPVIFEDNWLAVIHKPAGLPTSGNYFRTIENALPHNLDQSTEFDALNYPLPVHRLDSPTSGILLVAKTKLAQRILNDDFSAKKIHKVYYALVHGLCDDEQINLEIENKPAQTMVMRLKQFRIEDQSYSLVRAKPLTGRTHQIRIHLEHMGNPIVGDKLYGNTEETFFKNKNLFLFAGGIELIHPVTTEKLSFEIELPKRFRNLARFEVR
ncbi:RluA family pseudouridine synthase [Christiangramia aquimixticola]|uniref:RluA family pseudouridine synthase n=1 Tax=Christiangramia aquimixticola TaxID=1697558 RepID=UPI003AA82F99